MSQYQYREHYVRHLPHFQPADATLFVTFRLAGSLPGSVLERLQGELEERERAIRRTAPTAELQERLVEERKRYFGRFDAALDSATSGPFWLRDPRVASLTVEALHFRDRSVYDLDVFCVMPNHVHVVFRPLVDESGNPAPLQTILHSLKRYTAAEANLLLGREGAFWQHESFDHVVRDRDEWERIVRYVLENPVKAGLVARWEDWPWSYLREREI